MNLLNPSLAFLGPLQSFIPFASSVSNAIQNGTSISDAIWGDIGATLSTLGGAVGSVAGGMTTSLLSGLPPGGTFPQVYHDSAIYFGNALQSVAFIVPVGPLVTCLTLALTVKLSLWMFHVLRWVANFVRGIPTGRFYGKQI